MANPVVTTDKPNYLPGEVVHITIDYDARTTTITGTDQDGRVGTATFVVGNATAVANPAGVVTKVSDNGTMATFTMTA
jgi:hypothetical protein